MSDQERGLYRKYNVERLNDPAGKHAECEYYVLDLVHDRHAAPALLAYADSCASQFPELAKELRHEASEIPNAAPFLVDPESEAANPVWDQLVEACQQGWPEKLLSWNTSPTELIVDLINERDRALEQLQLNAAPREGASSPAGPAQNGEPAGAAPFALDKEQARRLWHRQLGRDTNEPCPSERECRAFDAGFVAAIAHFSIANRTFPICKDHTAADWNQPALEDDNCILCRLFYLEAQEGLLEEWQQRTKRAEDAIAEVQRPLDAQMARLNETVTRLNAELEAARSARTNLGEARKLLDDYVGEALPPEGGVEGSPFTVTFTYSQWRVILRALGTPAPDRRKA